MGSHYFVYFGTLGIFLPYFNLFCHHLGFSGLEIGVLSTVKTAGVVVFPVLWAMAADRLNARKSILLFCSLASALVWSLLFFSREFIPILIILALHSIFYSPIISFIEASAMDILGPEKKKYGASRAWGSFAFILMAVGLGRILSDTSTMFIIPLILGGSCLQFVLGLGMPKAKKKMRKAPSESGLISFFSLNTGLFLLAAFFMLVSHGAYYGFFSIYLEEMGLSTGFIGMAWGLASFAEIGVMAGSDRIFRHFKIRTVLLFSFIVAMLRWWILFMTSSALVILFSQLLHAFTYGAFHVASILAIEKLSPRGGKTVGQAVNNAVTYGAGMMVGFFFSGMFYDAWKGYLFLASSGIAMSGGMLMLFLYWKNAFVE
ncbi:MFS transporter [Desulfocicer vacuolatum]|uniref:MFS transporter n=1 Tax=Desulfocicer vacuolatum TaxID=2298 RepID=UPI001E65A1E2|nr:MFS transporter [Desulfocicer vacuolatum]